MGLSIIKYSIFFIACFYVVVNVHSNDDEDDEPVCFNDMKTGDVAYFKPCSRCTCEEHGVACKTCPAGDPQPAPKDGCRLEALGDFPDCCTKTEVCD